jgi:hypothetical protein
MRVCRGCPFWGMDCCWGEALAEFLDNLGDVVDFVVMVCLYVLHGVNDVSQPSDLVVDVL